MRGGLALVFGLVGVACAGPLGGTPTRAEPRPESPESPEPPPDTRVRDAVVQGLSLSMPRDRAEAVLAEQGYARGEDGSYQKEEGGVQRRVEIFAVSPPPPDGSSPSIYRFTYDQEFDESVRFSRRDARRHLLERFGEPRDRMRSIFFYRDNPPKHSLAEIQEACFEEASDRNRRPHFEIINQMQEARIGLAAVSRFCPGAADDYADYRRSIRAPWMRIWVSRRSIHLEAEWPEFSAKKSRENAQAARPQEPEEPVEKRPEADLAF